MSNVIDCKNISFGYDSGKPEVIKNVTFSIKSGQLITLLGPNGAGKSTLLNCLCGFIKPQKGIILLKGEDINKKRQKQVAQVIAYVPQKVMIPFDYTVKDYAVMGRTAHLNVFERPDESDYRMVDKALLKLGVKELENRPINTLSGGEQQKVCIARALVQEPDLIILDEPTSALDYGNQVRVLRLIKDLSADGYSILMTSHNPDQCLMLQSDVAILNKEGNLIFGTCESILTESGLRDLYGVELKLVYSSELRRTVCLPAGLSQYGL